MWWLDSETQTIRETQPLLPEQIVAEQVAEQVVAEQVVAKQVVAGQVCPSAVPVKVDIATDQSSVKPKAKKKAIHKCVSPLVDLLTPNQERANRLLSQVQCGHEAEIERLVADVGSLEKSIRQSSLKMESQQAIIEGQGILAASRGTESRVAAVLVG